MRQRVGGKDAGMLTARLALAVGLAALVIGGLAAYAVTLPGQLPTVPAARIAAAGEAPAVPATGAASPAASPSPPVVLVPPVPPVTHLRVTVTAVARPPRSPRVVPPPVPVPVPVVPTPSPPVVCPLEQASAQVGPIVPGCPPTCPPNAMCAPPPTSPAPVIIGDSANGSTLHVTVGTRIEVELGSTYWSFNPPSNPAVLEPTPHVGPLPMIMCPMIPGSGCGTAAQDYLARAPGTSVISASRVSCGEALRCTGTAGRFSVTVVVGG